MSKRNNKNSPEMSYGVLDSLMGYKLRRAQISFFTGFATRCSDRGITPGLFGVLAMVQANPGQTQTAIATALGNDRSAMVSVVDKLEALGVVERKPAESDRRSHALFLTEKGETFFEDLLKEVQSHEEDFLTLLKDGEKEALMDMLDRFSSVYL